MCNALPPETPEQQLARKIRDIRERRGLTQAQLALQISKLSGPLIGVNQQKISRWESGQSIVPAVELEALAKALRLPLSEFEVLP